MTIMWVVDQEERWILKNQIRKSQKSNSKIYKTKTTK